MAFSPAALLDRFRRDKVKDPFGGDDLFDGESRFAGQGPKIALIASGVLFLALLGGAAAIFMTGDASAPVAVSGSLADIEVVEDAEPEAAAPADAAAAVPAPGAPAPAADAISATDRSAARRPWLAQGAAPDAAAPRLGVAEAGKKTPDAKPAEAKPAETKAAEAKAAEAKPADVKPAETKPADVKPAEVKPAEAKPAETKPETKTAAVMAPPAATAPVIPPAPEAPKEAVKPGQPTSLLPAAPAAGDQKVEEKAEVKEEPAPVEDPHKDVGGIPALQAAGQAPGAPRRFENTGDGGPNVAGGRPRLTEPPLPPTDKITVAAPPPRYASLTDIKRDAGTTAPAPNAIKVAFIVGGLGLSQSATDAAINKLPAAVTLAFSPYARDLKKWMEKAKEKGHEVLIEVPMESKQFPAEDPGPLGLLTSAEAKDNTERLETILKESTNAIGVLDVMGSKFRESNEHITPVFAKLKQSNLFYVQGTPGVRVGEAGVPTAVADVVLDERPFRAAVDARLDYAERLAKYQGSAVVSLGAKPVSFERLVLWNEQAAKKGIVLAPISQVLIKQ